MGTPIACLTNTKRLLVVICQCADKQILHTEPTRWDRVYEPIAH